MDIITKEILDLVRDASQIDNEEERKSKILSARLGDARLNSLVLNYFSEFMYQDGEMLKKIEDHRGGQQMKGSLMIDLDEINIMMQAFRSPQYKRFFYHVMNAYGNNNIYPILDDHVFDCCICWKKTFGSTMHELWFRNGDTKDPNKEYLAFTAEGGTKTSICLDCLVQLKCFIDIVKMFDEYSKRD